MYKTIGKMGCDKKVGEIPYYGGSLAGLQKMIEEQAFQKLAESMGDTNSDEYEDQSRYLRISDQRRTVITGKALQSFGFETTPKNHGELPDELRILGEDPIWIQKLQSHEIQPYQLGLRIKDLVAQGILQYNE